jgi:ABC-type transport system involved in multi-copper enzyme maturation permease subunit
VNNPVLKREFITSLRTKRAVALALVFLGVLAGLVMLMWPAEGVFSLAAQNSHKLFIILSMGFLALVSLCAPSFTAVSITVEKERETYDLLYDTMLRPDEIVLGKLVSGVGFVMLLIFASAPMMGACYVLGGVTFGEILKVYLLVTAAAVFFGLMGLYCSARMRNSYRSLITCYILIIAIGGATWVPSVILGQWAESVHFIHLIRGLSPFAAMTSVVYPAMFAGEHPVQPGTFGQFADGMWVFLILAGSGGVVLLAQTLSVVAHPPQPKKRKDTVLIEDQKQLKTRKLKFPFYLIDPRKRKRMISPLFNVIAVKEMRCKAFGRAEWLLRSFFISFGLSLVMAFLPLTQMSFIGIDTIVFTCVSIPLAIIILLSPVLTATAVTGERESGIFDMLRATLVSPWKLIMGKMQVAWFFTALLIISTLPTFFVLAYVSSSPQDMEYISKGLNLVRPFNFQFGEGWAALSQVKPDFFWGMGAAFGVVVMAMLFATSLGTCASAFCRNSSTATAIAYGVLMFFAVGTLVPYFISDNLPGWLVTFFLSLNPFAAAAKAVSNIAFPDQPPGLWIQHIWITAAGAIFLAGAAMGKVWLMMKPQE